MDTPTLKEFQAHVNSVFTLAVEDGTELGLVLVSAERVSTPAGASPGSDRPFSLLFRGPSDHPFEQSIKTLSHPEMGTLQIFLVPIQPNNEGPLYEAVFA